jgi:hypothetical protein
VFASDLSGTDLGVALHAPLPFGTPIPPSIAESIGLPNFNADATDQPCNSGKIGDIAFFDSHGKYQWVRNAFHTAVSVFPRLF